MNHSWHTTLYVTPCGLTTAAMAYGDRAFEVEFDFHAHRLHIRTSDGGAQGFALEPLSVAMFYSNLVQALAAVDIEVRISRMPNEIADPIRFDLDETHRSYD